MDARESKNKFAQADSLYRAGRYAEALALLEEVNRANPNQKNVLFPTALCLDKLNRRPEAAALCDQLIVQFGDPRARDLQTRLAEPASPVPPAIHFPDIDLDFERPPVRVSNEKQLRESARDPVWIGAFVLGAMGLFALAALLAYAEMTGSYAAMSAVVAAPDPQMVETPEARILLYRVLGSEIVSLLAGFAAAYLSLQCTNRLIYANAIDNIKEIVRCVAWCHLIMLTCIGIAFVPRILKNRYDMSRGQLAASIAIYLVSAYLLSTGLNKAALSIATNTSGIDPDTMLSLAIEYDEKLDTDSPPTQFSGDIAPPLHIATWVKGDAVTLEEGRGKDVYVVEFWATWCPPCRKSIPHLGKLQEKYRDKNVIVIGVTDEDMSDVMPFVQKMDFRMDYTVAIDKDKETAGAYMGSRGLQGIPHAFIVDKQGKLAWHGHPLGGLEKALDSML